MKERPIIFSAPMVKAILDGKKTQTRRIVKPQPFATDGTPDKEIEVGIYVNALTGLQEAVVSNDSCGDMAGSWLARCPYGAPGDRLWVRETFQAFERREQRFGGTGPLAGASMRVYAYPVTEDSIIEYRADSEKTAATWRSSIHMPRWASRITLEITDVRVQRLQDISEEDALAEGVTVGSPKTPHEARIAYKHLWNEINGKHAPWESNPWCWAVTFRRI